MILLKKSYRSYDRNISIFKIQRKYLINDSRYKSRILVTLCQKNKAKYKSKES